MLFLSPATTDPSPVLIIISTGIIDPDGPLLTANGASRTPSKPPGEAPDRAPSATDALRHLRQPRPSSPSLPRPPSTYASAISSRPGIRVGLRTSTSVTQRSTSKSAPSRPPDLHLGRSMPDFQISTSIVRPPSRTPPPPSTSEQLSRPPSTFERASLPASEQAPSDISASLGSLSRSRPPLAFEHGRSRPPSTSRQSPFGRLSLPWLPPVHPASLGLRAWMLPASLGLPRAKLSGPTEKNLPRDRPIP